MHETMTTTQLRKRIEYLETRLHHADRDAVRRRLQKAVDATRLILADREKSQPTGQHALF